MPHNDPFAGGTVNADWAYNLSHATTYTPELTASTTDPNLGADGTATGWYHRSGHLITGWAEFLFSGTGLSAGSGTYAVSLPLDVDASLFTISGSLIEGSSIGAGYAHDDSTSGNSRLFALWLNTASTVRMAMLNGTDLFVQNNSPFTWAAGDRLAIRFAYVADSSVL